ncbi:hypothetical protein EMCRGX_G033257 [Ephydatia muelleri]
MGCQRPAGLSGWPVKLDHAPRCANTCIQYMTYLYMYRSSLLLVQNSTIKLRQLTAVPNLNFKERCCLHLECYPKLTAMGGLHHLYAGDVIHPQLRNFGFGYETTAVKKSTKDDNIVEDTVHPEAAVPFWKLQFNINYKTAIFVACTQGEDGRRWVFDEEDQKRVTEACHDDKLGGGHFGRDKTLQKACSRFYWHDTTNDKNV